MVISQGAGLWHVELFSTDVCTSADGIKLQSLLVRQLTKDVFIRQFDSEMGRIDRIA